MARRRLITMATLWAAAAALADPRPAAGAASLSALSAPTVQTLIDLGTDGVVVGDDRFFDFTYTASATAPAADAVRVNPTAAADGLRFIAPWVADAAAPLSSSTIGYDVAPVDGATLAAVGLLANGTAPVPAAGTFVTTSLSVVNSAGDPVTPVLSTFDDGHGVPANATDVDAAAAPFDPPQPTVGVTETIIAASNDGGVATASVVQNRFAQTAVPEPATTAALAGVGLGWAGHRRRKAK